MIHVCVYTWMRKDDGPTIAYEVVDLELAMGGVHFKIRNSISNRQTRHLRSNEAEEKGLRSQLKYFAFKQAFA